MLGFNNKEDNEQSEKLADFLDICSFIETFKEEIRNLLIQKQGGFNHVGKVATKRFSKQKIENKIKDLEQQKQEAVDSENFIAAEALKNQIEKLRSSI